MLTEYAKRNEFHFVDRKKESAGGGVLEFAGFCLQVCQWAFQREPKSLKASAILNDAGVDVDTSIELIYGDNKVAKIRINLLKDDGFIAKIVGKNGQVMVNRVFVCIFCDISILKSKQ